MGHASYLDKLNACFLNVTSKTGIHARRSQEEYEELDYMDCESQQSLSEPRVAIFVPYLNLKLMQGWLVHLLSLLLPS